MKRFCVLLFLVTIVIGIDTLQTDAGQIYAGIAQAEITPPTGGRTTGYSSAQPTDGVHDPIYAKVLILKSDETTLAIVSWDTCVFNSPKLHESMSELGIDRLLLLNTHTHAGPNLGQTDFPSSENPWRNTVEERTLAAIEEAQQNLFPAYFAAGEGSIQLGYNRLVRQPEGHAITHFENPSRVPYEPVDPTVGIIRITDDSQTIRAVVVCYACHAVVLGPKNRKLSADYPGVLSQEVKKKLGDNVLCFFVQGGAGDINPLIMGRTGDPELDFPYVDEMGKLLAEEVLKTVERMKDVEGKSSELLTASKMFQVGHRFEADKPIDVGVTSLLINQEIGIITMPGEPFHKFQVDIRKMSALPHTFFFGYCCNDGYDWPSYLPDLESAARGGYGASDTTKAEVGAGERLIDYGLAQLYQLRGMLKSEPIRHINE